MTGSERPVADPAWWVVTDLDGTLLDHDSYSYRAALPALGRLRRAAVPVVLASSKTLAEMRPLQAALELQGPLIAENGAVVQVGDAERVRGPGIDTIRDLLGRLRRERGLSFEGFADWDVDSLARATGLDAQSAERALQRRGSEPLLWRDTPQALARFTEDLAAEGLRVTRGGRFVHVLGADVDKAVALAELTADLATAPRVVALGDSANDLDLLRAAEVAVVVRRHDGQHLRATGLDHAVYTRAIGPQGWNEALMALLDDWGD
jgi:mannosyl-3-phosphoglycerate phosphatase